MHIHIPFESIEFSTKTKSHSYYYTLIYINSLFLSIPVLHTHSNFYVYISNLTHSLLSRRRYTYRYIAAAWKIYGISAFAKFIANDFIIYIMLVHFYSFNQCAIVNFTFQSHPILAVNFSRAIFYSKNRKKHKQTLRFPRALLCFVLSHRMKVKIGNRNSFLAAFILNQSTFQSWFPKFKLVQK